jgi:hypothetical protein
MKNYDLMEKPKESANSARMDRSEALQGVAETCVACRRGDPEETPWVRPIAGIS